MKIKTQLIFFKYFLFLLLLLPFCGCNAQSHKGSEQHEVLDSLFFTTIDSSYSFIQYDSNRFFFCGDSSRMLKFAEKFYSVLSTGKGHVSIMHIGASHVQGGTFPHQIRRNILLGSHKAINSDSYYPVAERGMLFPYSAAVKCNNPFDYKVTRTRALDLTRNVYKEPQAILGLCGIAVTASDSSAEIGISLSDPELSFPIDTISLLGYSVGDVIPRIRVFDNGDSILIDPVEIDVQKRCYRYAVNVPQFSIVISCDSGQAFTLTGVYLGSDAPGITVHSIGVNGASVADYLNKCPFLTTDLQMINPDLVIFGIGINDAAGPSFDSAAFRLRYVQLVDSIRSINPECAFVFITNNDSFRGSGRSRVHNANGLQARDAFYRVACQCGGVVWDQFAVMGGYGSIRKWTQNELAQRDLVHFTRNGYRLLGDLFSNAFFHAIGTLTGRISNNSKTNPQPSEKDDNERHIYISY